MASPTEICNRALQKLGAARITSLTDQSKNARELNAAYDSCRLALLREHRWNFAIQRFAIAANATAPAFGPANAYPLPAGALTIMPPDPSSNTNDRDWIIENGQILSDATAPLQVRCIMDVTDANRMDPTFREALSSKLAEELAEALTQSNTKKQACADMFKADIGRAKKANAIENVPIVSADDLWITTRV